MKIEITEKGVNHGGKRLEVGATMDIEGDKLPGHMVGKVRIIQTTAPEPAPERVQVTNPAAGAIGPQMSAQERQTLLGEAAKQLADDAFKEDGVPDVRALNRELAEGVKPFTAEERNQLWPGVAAAVKAAREAG